VCRPKSLFRVSTMVPGVGRLSPASVHETPGIPVATKQMSWLSACRRSANEARTRSPGLDLAHLAPAENGHPELLLTQVDRNRMIPRRIERAQQRRRPVYGSRSVPGVVAGRHRPGPQRQGERCEMAKLGAAVALHAGTGVRPGDTRQEVADDLAPELLLQVENVKRIPSDRDRSGVVQIPRRAAAAVEGSAVAAPVIQLLDTPTTSSHALLEQERRH